MYQYKAHVVSCYDGDTVTVDVDLGFYTSLSKIHVRLYGINAPEVKGDTKQQGLISRDALRGRIEGKDIILTTIKDEQEKYGRWLGIIDLNGENINQWLVDQGLAVVYLP